MKSKRHTAASVAAAAICVVGGCQSAGTPRADHAEVAAPVVLPEIVAADWKGRIVVADFWATWCTPCKASSPNVQLLHERYAADPGVLVVGVHADDNDSIRVKPSDYVAEHGYTFPIVPKGQAVGTAFGVRALPTYVVLDAQGREVLRHVGMMNQKVRETIEAEVERLRG